MRLTVGGVDMIEPDGGGADETYAAAFEQRIIASGSRADQHGIRIPDVLACYLRTGKVVDGPKWFQDAPQKGDMIVSHYSHYPDTSVCLTHQALEMLESIPRAW
jgi:hypothetical protein